MCTNKQALPSQLPVGKEEEMILGIKRRGKIAVITALTVILFGLALFGAFTSLKGDQSHNIFNMTYLTNLSPNEASEFIKENTESTYEDDSNGQLIIIADISKSDAEFGESHIYTQKVTYCLSENNTGGLLSFRESGDTTSEIHAGVLERGHYEKPIFHESSTKLMQNGKRYKKMVYELSVGKCKIGDENAFYSICTVGTGSESDKQSGCDVKIFVNKLGVAPDLNTYDDLLDYLNGLKQSNNIDSYPGFTD